MNEKREWLIQGNSDNMLAPMRDALQSMIPNLEATSWQTKRCVITYSEKGYPLIDELLKEQFTLLPQAMAPQPNHPMQLVNWQPI